MIVQDELEEWLSATLSWENKIIILNQNHHLHRHRFSLAHELGHHFMQHDQEINSPNDEGETYEEKRIVLEREADLFAGCLLMPEKDFSTAFKKGEKPEQLSRRFLVSKEAVWIRINNLNLIS